jgi:hypothetical protein
VKEVKSGVRHVNLLLAKFLHHASEKHIIGSLQQTGHGQVGEHAQEQVMTKRVKILTYKVFRLLLNFGSGQVNLLLDKSLQVPWK